MGIYLLCLFHLSNLEISIGKLLIYILISILSCLIVKNFILNFLTLDYRIEVIVAFVIFFIIFSFLIFDNKIKRIPKNKYAKK